jgi:hypothetical protein
MVIAWFMKTSAKHSEYNAMQTKTLFGAIGVTFLILLAGVAEADIVSNAMAAF